LLTAACGDEAKTPLQLAERLQDAHWEIGLRAAVEEPFVVASVGVDAADARRARRVVRWAVDQLRRMFGTPDPEHIVTIWLFPDDRTYRLRAWSLFEQRPRTPYGYYTPQYRAILLDLATGTGTLVHELIHPMLAVDFPACPPWWGEGFASLFEECDEVDGEMRGLPNWRLPELRAAISASTLPPLTALLRMPAHAFHGEGESLHYARARCLCRHLQEKRLLRRFYAAFERARTNDRTGERTLAGVVGDLGVYEQALHAYALG
jgi:hypothetical protein